MSDPHVVIIGCGFGGLWAVQGLARAAVRVTLVDRVNHHLFQPLLYQVATAGLAAPSIAAPVRHILAGQRNATILLGDVTRIDAAARRIELDDATTIDYDYLIVASGATHSYFGRDDWACFAPGLKTLEDAFEIRRRILLAYEHAERESNDAKRAPWLTFVVIGAGATGVELAGTMAEIARHTLQGEFRRFDSRASRILLLEGGSRVLPAFPLDLSAKAQAQLERLGVTVRTNAKVTAIDEYGIAIGAERIDARTMIWAAGVAASPLGKTLGVPLDRAGRVLVEPDLAVPDHPEIFVVGDLATIPSHQPPVPGVAPAAKQMGRLAARNVLARIAGQATTPFRYTDFGMLATIGRSAAVVQMGKLKLSGFPAWALWLLAHVYFLINFRNRLVVLLDWGWSYLTFKRFARIVVGRKAD